MKIVISDYAWPNIDIEKDFFKQIPFIKKGRT